MRVWIAYVVTESETFGGREYIDATEEIGTFSTKERAEAEAARVEAASGDSGRVSEVEVDAIADWATDQALAEDLTAQRRG